MLFIDNLIDGVYDAMKGLPQRDIWHAIYPLRYTGYRLRRILIFAVRKAGLLPLIKRILCI